MWDFNCVVWLRRSAAGYGYDGGQSYSSQRAKEFVDYFLLNNITVVLAVKEGRYTFLPYWPLNRDTDCITINLLN
jgi:hypothetical protein